MCYFCQLCIFEQMHCVTWFWLWGPVLGKECSHVRDVANKCLYIDNKAKSLLPSPEPASQPTGYYDDIEVALKRPRGSIH